MDHGTRVLLILGVLAACGGPDQLATTTPSTSARVCTAVGCSSGVDLLFGVAESLDTLRSASLTVCRNADCVAGSLSSLQTSGFGNDSTATLPDPTLSAQVDVFVRTESSNVLSLEIVYKPIQYDALEDGYVWTDGLADGDVYSVEVIGPAQRILLLARVTVGSYDVVRPNGPDCTPTCLIFRAQLDAVADAGAE